MSCDFHVAIVQNEIKWNDVCNNLLSTELLLKSVISSDLILLPEMFATGFVVGEQPLADVSAEVLPWVQRMSKRHDSALAGSVAVHDAAGWHNRLYFVTPDGAMQYYDKRHLFLGSSEAQHFQRGGELPVFHFRGWKICPQICYDLRFPVWCRNVRHNGEFKYDLLLYVANWPASRAMAWNTLLRARAIENQCFVAACNCIGTDPQNHHYQGDSQLIAPDGNLIAKADSQSQLLQGSCSHQHLTQLRVRFPVANDWD